MKENVLIFPCGSEIGLELFRSLAYSTHFNIIGGSSVDDHGKFVFANYIGGIPNVKSTNFISSINALIQEHDIKYIYPAHDDVLLKLAQEDSEGRLGCQVISSPLDTCEVTRSKKRTYDAFRGLLRVPNCYDDSQKKDMELPVFLKPDVGQGSKGVHRADSITDIAFYTSKNPDLLILEYLPGKEFTVDCFTDNQGELRFVSGRERKRIMNGISVNSTTVEMKDFLDMAKIINKHLEFNGAWFFQLKEAKGGELALLEIAPRIAGTMGLARCKGVNLPLLSLFNAKGIDISIVENDYSLTIDRALENKYPSSIVYKHVYIDFHDLIILNDKINTDVIKFIFQCINDGIKTHLITRHKEDIYRSLAHYKLSNIFDEIIQVDPLSEKHSYIVHSDAIFIDDSHEERSKVHRECSIPVFDSHMLEGLIK